MRITFALLLLVCLRAGAQSSRPGNDTLNWLVANQAPTGAWAANKSASVGATSLALLSFTGAGYTAAGTSSHPRYRQCIRDARRWLTARQESSGAISASLREHALATLALCESRGPGNSSAPDAPAKRALAYVARHATGDDPVTACLVVMALVSGRKAGLEVDVGALRRAGKPGGAGDRPRAAAARLLARLLLGDEPRRSPQTKALLDRCLAHPPSSAKGRADGLYWLFGTLATKHIGGAAWRLWSRAMRVAIQDKRKADGSWDPAAKEVFGAVGASALRLLCLEAYYRYDRVFGVATADDDGSSDAPFSGPGTNSAIGLGGGVGGSYGGRRGGRRVLRAAGGGGRAHRTESYDRIRGHDFRRVRDEDTSTFSIDVDTAAYANVRRFLAREKRLPPRDAVRIEEMINYFPYAYAAPLGRSGRPFAVHVEVATCPWKTEHRLVRVGLQAARLEKRDRPASNLVFLIDVSGSMKSPHKLPLLKRALDLLVRELDRRDEVSVVVYAGAAGLVLPPTRGDDKAALLAALERLSAGGSTNGGEGIALAYATARSNLVPGGINRVILCTDGDFNVGVTDRGALTRLVEAQAGAGVELSVLGFGRGNLKDATMEELSNRGNGNYAYIDSLQEARKVLVEQMTGTLMTVAKDVKVQVFFNPERVAAWRLIGYENRLLDKQDFNDDKKDAGEIGAGHAVTALYEIVPAGPGVSTAPAADPNPFLERAHPSALAAAGALMRLRLRYKPPQTDESVLIESDVTDTGTRFDDATADFRWVAAVAAFGMLLRDSEFRGEATWDAVLELAAGALGDDPGGYRAEMLDLVRRARTLCLQSGTEPE